MNNNTVDKPEKVLDLVISDLVYIPNEAQRKAKVAFWMRASDSPRFSPDGELTLSAVMSILPGEANNLATWWKTPGFREWFANQEEWRERLEGLAHLVLDRWTELMLSSDPKVASAQATIGRNVLEAARKMPEKGSHKVYADEKISRMNPAQLEEYIRRNTAKLNPTKSTTEE